ncbi:MAG: hypothetical protein ACHQZS_03855 [Candidatus Binatales bacterium]
MTGKIATCTSTLNAIFGAGETSADGEGKRPTTWGLQCERDEIVHKTACRIISTDTEGGDWGDNVFVGLSEGRVFVVNKQAVTWGFGDVQLAEMRVDAEPEAKSSDCQKLVESVVLNGRQQEQETSICEFARKDSDRLLRNLATGRIVVLRVTYANTEGLVSELDASGYQRALTQALAILQQGHGVLEIPKHTQ